MNYILTGGPATGKGTRSEILSKALGIAHISTGDILREVSKKDETMKDMLSKGILIPDETMTKLLKERLMQDDCKNGYILDGYPRNLQQANSYEELLNKINKELGYVIFLDIDKELAAKRIAGRIVCPNCGSSYNLYIEDVKPKEENICDRCHHKLEKRSDDNEATIEKRFDTYMENTKDLLDYYKKLNVYIKSKITDQNMYYIFLDEIQNVNRFEDVVNSLRASLKNISIFITGSNSKLLSDELSTVLSGRYVLFHIYPLSYKEFIALTEKDPYDEDSFWDYAKWGGLPNRCEFSNETDIKNYLYSVFDSIILRDIVKRLKLQDTTLFDLLLQYLIY